MERNVTHHLKAGTVEEVDDDIMEGTDTRAELGFCIAFVVTLGRANVINLRVYGGQIALTAIR